MTPKDAKEIFFVGFLITNTNQLNKPGPFVEFYTGPFNWFAQNCMYCDPYLCKYCNNVHRNT